MGDALFDGFDEAPRRPSMGGTMAQLREENARLSRRVAELSAATAARAIPQPFREASAARRENVCSVTFHPHAPLELRHALERLLRSASVDLPPEAAGGATTQPAAALPQAADVHYMQSYCVDVLGEQSGWAALQQHTLSYHRPLALSEGESILFTADPTDGRGRRRGGGGGGGDGRRYWELQLDGGGADAGDASAAGAQKALDAAAEARVTPGVLSRALMDALGMSASYPEPPPYLNAMRAFGYPPAYVAPPHQPPAAAAAADPDALLFFTCVDDPGQLTRDGAEPDDERAEGPDAAGATAAAETPPTPPTPAQAAPAVAQARDVVMADEAEEGELLSECGSPPPLASATDSAGVPRAAAREAEAASSAPPAAAAAAAAVQLFAYPGLNAPPPAGADLRVWARALTPHAAPGPMRAPPHYRPHELAMANGGAHAQQDSYASRLAHDPRVQAAFGSAAPVGGLRFEPPQSRWQQQAPPHSQSRPYG
jgi:hypothetical protein